MNARPRSRGITLVEVIVVILIVGAVAAVTLYFYSRAREAARRIRCVDNLRQLVIAARNYESTFGRFPSGYVGSRPGDPCCQAGAAGPGQYGWAVLLMPHLDSMEEFNSFNLALPVLDPALSTAHGRSNGTFLCPSDDSIEPFTLLDPMGEMVAARLPRSHYVAAAGLTDLEVDPDRNTGIFYRNSRTTIASIKDGAANTALLGERSSFADSTWLGVVPGGWICPTPGRPNRECKSSAVMVLGRARISDSPPIPVGPGAPEAGVDNFASNHPGGANFAFADGAVRSIATSIDPKIFAGLFTRAGGEVLSSEEY